MLSGWQRKLASLIYRPLTADWTQLSLLGRVCIRQCNSHASIRFRRYCQLVKLYQQLYNESSLRGLFAHFDRTLWRRFLGRWREGFMLGAAGFSFQSNGIDDELMKRAANLICDFEHGPQASSATLGDNNECSDGNGDDSESSNWEVVVNQPNFRVWKRPVPEHSHIFEYRFAGTYNDIPASAFFMAQLDLDYRRQWDEQVVTLDVIDSDERSGAEVVRWITHYPYPMYPREYIYVRRACVDSCRKLMTLASHSTDHPGYPLSNKHVRVDIYSSNMVVRPHKEFDQLGMDYVLTYYDDPKAKLPSAAYKWMVNYGVPRFVLQVHDAAKKLHERMGDRQVAEFADKNLVQLA